MSAKNSYSSSKVDILIENVFKFACLDKPEETCFQLTVIYEIYIILTVEVLSLQVGTEILVS